MNFKLKEVLNNLNGWQRLWLVLSILYIIPVVVITTIKISDNNRDYEIRKKELVSILSVPAPDKSSHPGRILNPDEWEPVTETPETPHRKWDSLGPINATTNANIDQIYRNDILKTLVGAFIFWVLPVISVYILGSAIAWIIRGFIEKKII